MRSRQSLAVFLLSVSALVDLAAAPPALPAGQNYAAPCFPADDRRARVARVQAEIDQEFRAHADRKRCPGLVWGIVLDGELVHAGALGFANVEEKIPAAADTRFRIASMTKSFTALAILKLRDAGRLALTDRVDRYVPELRRTAPLTTDAPPITLQHLLTMSAGFPEDNPWGDRQLADSPAEFQAFLRDGLALSNPPGVAFEYSNLGYALLGRIITQVTGIPYQQYITREILQPLGMKDTVWEYSEVPATRLALGYRSLPEGGWRREPLLHDGTYGAMGGLLTTLHDFVRYVAFHQEAWPARNDPDSGIVGRATRREMHQPAMFSSLAATTKSLANTPLPTVNFYGYGLSWSTDSAGHVRVGHSGGLPGFGSNWRFYPEHGVAVISFANVTYAGTGTANARVGALLVEKAGLPRRVIPAATMLATRQRQVVDLIQTWDAALADSLVAESFFPDRSREDWQKEASEKLAQIGAVRSVGDMSAENQLRGTFSLIGEKGRLEVFFTLTPERNPRVQELRLTVKE